MSEHAKTLTRQQAEDFIRMLQKRFEAHMHRHAGIAWSDVQTKLEADLAKLWSLHEMESTSGEPDVVGFDAQTSEHLFFDCAPESPAGRRNLCYDHAALLTRKQHKPASSAVEMADAMGITLLTEDQYRALQQLEAYDTKTSSWIATPEGIRALGGALFCDRRYDHVFVYHNGADSYYGARGFRGSLRL